MEKEPLVLSFDYGTQSVRAILFNQKGETLGKVKIAFEPYFSLNSGWAEQYAEVYWDKLCEASQRLKAEVGELWDQIVGVGCTTIRDTCVCVDKNGKVLRPIILWLDQRKIENVEKRITPSKKRVLNLVNMYEIASNTCKASPCNWISENEPEVFENMHKYMMFSGYMTFKLTGNMVDAVSNQIGHIPFNYKKKKWSRDGELTSCLYDVKRKHMVDLVEAGDKIGEISEQAAKDTGLPVGMTVIATGSDKGCESLGCGSIGSDSASLSFGTTATVQLTTDKYVEPQPFAPAYPAVMKGKFNPEMEIYRGYWMLTWFKKEFAEKECVQAKELGVSAEELLNKRLQEIPAGSDGLILQPYWSPGLKIPNAKGAILGFSDVHTRVHLYRAIIEGIGYGLYDGLRTMEKRTGKRVKRVLVSGGGSQSDEICQITADMFGVPVQKVQTYETSALGCAITTFTGLGYFNSFEEAVGKMVRISKEYKPDKKEHKVYSNIYEKVYKNIYKSNKKLYTEISKIAKGGNIQ